MVQSFLHTSIDTQAKILVCLRQNDLNLIQKFLPDHYQIIECNDKDQIKNGSYDLCIIDFDSFQKYRDDLIDQKQDAAPVLRPILLLSGDDRPLHQNGLVWNLADDIIQIPVPSKVLNARIQNLLRTRRYSLKLKEKNEELILFQKALGSTNTGVILTDALQPDNPIIYCNRKFKELTGYSEEEVLGRNCRFLQGDERDQKAIKKLRFLIDEGLEGQAVLRNYRKDGSMFWNEVKIAPVKNSDGEITHFIGTQNNITELVQTQKKLHEEKERYRLITEHATDMISMHEPDGTYLYVSPSSKKLIGYSPEELVGTSPFETMHPEDKRKIKRNFETLFDEDDEARIIFRKRTKAGNYKWVEAILRAIKDPNTNKVTEIRAATRDISEQKEYEEKLKKSERRWEQLVNKNPSLVQLTNTDFTIKYINPSGARLYGKNNPDELIGKSVGDFVFFEDPKTLKRRMRKALNGKSLSPKSFKVKTWDGRQRTIELQSVPVEYHNEQVLLTVGQDVTERTKYEEKLKYSLREKDVLLQEIHHRVKNNLAVVSGLLQIQRFNAENSEVQKILSDSEMRIKSMALIHEKLYQSPSLSQINMEHYIRDLTASIRDTVDIYQDIKIDITCDEVCLNVNQAVPCALIINELLSNSIEHAFPKKSGAKKIIVDITKKDDTISVSVKDNGIGLPKDKINNKSMGFTIIETLCHQLEAVLVTKNDNGSLVRFSFEKKEVRGSSSSFVQ